jgi:hypothetical protein
MMKYALHVTSVMRFAKIFFQVLIAPAFRYFSAVLELSTISSENHNDFSVMKSHHRHIQVMKDSIQQIFHYLNTNIFKSSDATSTLTIMFTLCIITAGTELWLLYLMKAMNRGQDVTQDHLLAIQTKWHDTIVALFSACKDFNASGEITESLFEVTNWKLDYG